MLLDLIFGFGTFMIKDWTSDDPCGHVHHCHGFIIINRGLIAFWKFDNSLVIWLHLVRLAKIRSRRCYISAVNKI